MGGHNDDVMVSVKTYMHDQHDQYMVPTQLDDYFSLVQTYGDLRCLLQHHPRTAAAQSAAAEMALSLRQRRGRAVWMAARSLFTGRGWERFPRTWRCDGLPYSLPPPARVYPCADPSFTLYWSLRLSWLPVCMDASVWNCMCHSREKPPRAIRKDMRKVYNWYYDMALQIVPFAIAGSALTASGYLTPQDTIHAILSFGAAGTAGWHTRAMFLRTMLIAMSILPGSTSDVMEDFVVLCISSRW